MDVTWRASPITQSSPRESLPIFVTFTGPKSLYLQGFTYDPRRIAVPLSEILQNFSSLTELRVDLQSYFSVTDEVGHLSCRNYTLQVFNVTGSPEELEALLMGTEFPSLRSLRLSISQGWDFPWSSLCNRAAAHFPALSTSPPRVLGGIYPPVMMQDITQLLSRQLTTIRLDRIPHRFTLSDLNTMITAWPPLRILFLSSPFIASFDANALVVLSQSPILQALSISVDLRLLTHPLDDDAVPLPRGSLEGLCVLGDYQIPPVLEEKLILAQNLLAPFPRLRIVWPSIRCEDTHDLTAIIKAINRMVAAVSFGRRRIFR